MLTHSCRLRGTVILLASLALGSAQAGGRRSPALHTGGALAPEKLPAVSARLPLSFEANQGQTDGRVRYLARGEGYSLFLTSTEAVLALRRPPLDRNEPGRKAAVRKAQRRAGTAGRRSPAATLQSAPTVVRMQLVEANPRPKVAGAKRLPGQVNYLLGRDPRKWHTRVPSYREVRYEGVYPGIDLVYYGNQRQLEYDFVVAPRADPRRIRLAFAGAKQVEVAPNGDLVLHTPAGAIRQQKPLLYQEIGGVRREVAGRYTLLPMSEPQAMGNVPSPEGRCQVGFQVAHYDATQPLVIDPVLSYATFLGGGTFDEARGIAVDRAGNTYVAGVTNSANFPTTPGAFDTSINSFEDVFVTKLNAAGSALLYSTYLGGDGFDRGAAIAVDTTGNAYVTGDTGSTDFPTTVGAFDRSHNGGEDAFATKLNAAGSALAYSTYLGGSNFDEGKGIAVDPNGNAYVTGLVSSTDFPTTPGAFATSHQGGFSDAFVTKVNAAGSALAYSTYLGGTDTSTNTFTEGGLGIAVSESGQAYVTGFTESANFPTTEDAFDTSLDGFGPDAFVTKVNTAGSALVYSTYLGGTFTEQGYGVAVDAAGSAYVAGLTTSSNFPTTPDAFDTDHNGELAGEDAFVTKLDVTGSTLAYSTYLGGSGNERAFGIAVQGVGSAYVTGFTESRDFPIRNAFDSSFNGGFNDAFVTQLTATGSALVFSTYLGGEAEELSLGIAVDAAGSAYVTGGTGSSDFPSTPGAFDSSFNGESDVFVVKFSVPLRDQIEALIRQIEQLVATGILQPGDSTALINALQEALRQLDQGHPSSALEQLRTFTNLVNALVRTGKLPAAQGTPLTNAAQALVTQLTPATLTVINTNDAGPGSLRQALETANISPGADTILFRIPTTDPGFAGGVFTIRLQSQLPAAQGSATLDGFSQTAFTGNTNPNGPEVVLNGSSAGSANGLQLDGVDSVVRGFVIQGFARSGIVLAGGQNRVEGCYIGTNAAGTVAVPNGENGIAGGGNNQRIGGTEARFRNVISGNGEDGIHLEGVSNTVVLGNFIGTNALGTAALPNLQSGVSLLDAHDDRVGGSEPGSRNVISGNGAFGVVLEDGNRIQVQGNYIGTDVRGERALPNGRHGVSVSEMGSVLIGGSSDATRNIISGNGGDGVQLTRGTSASQVQGNYVGLNAAGTAALANQGSGIEVEDGSNNLVGGTAVG